uniref:BTB domain-containing protein n=1 Tax=Arcella intermedia TaxID=1963864 RepID=A0A6B2L3Q2_9EUKA
MANNDHTYPDVHCIIDEKNTVLGHSFILQERMPQLFEENPAIKKKKKKNPKKANNIEFIKSEQITVEALQRVMVYAYCGQVDYRTFNPSKAIEVIRAATVLKVERLNQMCQKYLQSSLNIENIYKLLKYADHMNVEKAKQICMEFALGNADFFTSASAESLGFKLYQEVTALMLRAHKGDKPGNATNEIQVTMDDTIVEDFKRIYAANATKDITFMIQGTEVKAHKAILLDHSTELNALVNQTDDQSHKISRTPGFISLDEKHSEVSAPAFEALLRLLYYSDEELDMVHACQLYMFSRDYNLVRLSLLIEKVISNGEIAVNNVIPVLGVAFNYLMNENPELQNKLKDQGMKFVVQHVDKVDFYPLGKMASVIATQILQQVQQVLTPSWKTLLECASQASASADVLVPSGPPPPADLPPPTLAEEGSTSEDPKAPKDNKKSKSTKKKDQTTKKKK